MAVFYCQVCDRYIDLDWDVEHYDRCPTLEEDEYSECPRCKKQDYPLERTWEHGKESWACSRCCATEEDRKPKPAERKLDEEEETFEESLGDA